MEGKDNIKDLFSQKLGNYEANVNPELWAKISSQVAAGATTSVATGLSVIAKIAIGVGISAAAITTAFILTANPKTELVADESTQEKTQTTFPTEESVPEVMKNDSTPSDIWIQTDKTTTKKSSRGNRNTNDSEKIEIRKNKVDFIPFKGLNTIAGTSKEPTVVQGMTYYDMTKYGSSTEEVRSVDPDPEVTPIKVDPIKRYVNVFTPNGDNTNDYFELESEGLQDFSVVVFDPKGDVVFKSSDPKFRWDGRDLRTGEIVPSGNYMYMVSAYDSEGNPFPIYERLTINR